jgi:hypothetical protein
VQGPAAAPPAASSAVTLDVPYLPQTEALCGGAAVAMVFRYWGEAHAGVQQFDSLVDRRAGGIATEVLVDAVEQRQWRARRVDPSVDALRNEITARRPTIVLLQDRLHRYHYVVVIGTDVEHIVVHDPAWGPSRRLPMDEFLRRWQAAKFWSLVVLPRDVRSLSVSPRSVPLPPSAHARGKPPDVDEAPINPCDRLLDAAIDDVRQRGLAEADVIFGAVRRECPNSAGPLRELAGVRFAERGWRDAASLAEQALARDAHDAYAWEVLASSRFMQNDLTGALRAWNEVEKPRVDAVRIEGLSRTRYALVADAVALPAGSLLTADSFRRAKRRLEELPGQLGARIGYRPLPDGFAQVDVAIIERPARPRGALAWTATAARTAVDREVSVTVPGAAGQGELWTASWRWWSERPRVALSFATPHLGALPGRWRVEGSWEAQTYRFGRETTPGLMVRQQRAHGGLAVADWLTADLRYEVSAGIDSWNGERRTASVSGVLERRFAADRVTVAGHADAWKAFAGHPGFRSAGLRAALRSSTETRGVVYSAGGGIEAVSAAAPLALWRGAGEGHAREPLLRAHPLLQDGVISGAMFGQRLAYANGEVRRWTERTGSTLPIRIAVALFVDLARAARRAPSAAGDPFQIDAGVGLRVKVPGQNGTLRVDFGRGLRDGAHALTAGWQF